MTNQKFKKRIDELKDISLTDEEKTLLRANFLAQIKNETITREVFGWTWFLPNKWQLVPATLVLLIILGAGITFASEYSLPNDLLYPVKHKIYEPVARILKQEPTSLNNFEVDLLEERLDEAEKLIEENRLDEPTKKKIKENILEQIVRTEIAVKKIESKDKSEVKNKKPIKKAENILKEHNKVLNVLNAREPKSSDNKKDKKM